MVPTGVVVVDSSQQQEVVGNNIVYPVTTKTLRSHTVKAPVVVQGGGDGGGSPGAMGDGGGGMLEAEAAGHRRRRRRRRRKSNKDVPLDNLTRIKRRVKYLLMKMRVEQNLIDAYSGEGWKGQSREKIRPEQELQRAEAQILRSKLAIREAIHELDDLGLEGSLDENAFDSEGRIYHEEIFCAKCKSQEALLDNDIILCDGACNRGFHQYCLVPPLRSEEIPPGDEGWLCPVCECKMESIDVINAYLGTNFEVENSWEELFAEEAVAAAGGETKNGATGDWPSTDSEDEDFDPDGLEKRANSESESQSKEDGEDRDSSDSGSEVGGNEASSGPSSDKDGEEPGISQKKKHSSNKKIHVEENSGSAQSSDSDDSDVSLVDEFKTKDGKGNLGLGLRGSGAEESASDEEAIIIGGKRHRKAVDYKKLHDEMFGNTELDANFVSEDEDWGPKRRRRRTIPDDPSRLRPPRVRRSRARSSIDPSKGGDGDISHGVQFNPLSESHGDGGNAVPGDEGERRPWKRLPDTAVEELRRVVAVNQLPSKKNKEELASRLGLTFMQVHGWFKNQRHQALRKGLVNPRRIDLVASGSKNMSTANGVQISASERLSVPDISAPRSEMNTLGNAYLTGKLDEVQLRLLELKQTLEEFAKTTAAVDAEGISGEVEKKFGNGGIGLPANGKRVVYVPVAEESKRHVAAK